MNIPMHDLPGLAQGGIRREVHECAVHMLVVLCLKHLRNVTENTRHKDPLSLVEFSFLQENPRRLDATLWKRRNACKELFVREVVTSHIKPLSNVQGAGIGHPPLRSHGKSSQMEVNNRTTDANAGCGMDQDSTRRLGRSRVGPA
jgi:sarcosine oxidase delta subunit